MSRISHGTTGIWFLSWRLAISFLRKKVDPQFRRHMVAHIPDVNRHSLDNMRVNDKKKGFVWSAIGKASYDEGRWKEAEELLVQEIETRKRVLGPEHPDILTIMG